MKQTVRIPLIEAQKLLSSAVKPLPPVEIPLKAALGCVLAEPVNSAIDQPPFPRSPYDGYALIAADSAGASKAQPVTLEVVGESFAGVPANVALTRGKAVRIMTGAVIPEGADCVIMQEKTDYGEKQVKIFDALSPHQNYCCCGEDFSRGDRLIEAGTAVAAAEYAVLASADCGSVTAFPKPRIAVIATGDELQSTGEPLRPGHIYNSNSTFITARLAELGLTAKDMGSVRDDLNAIKSALLSATESADLVISTGGVSVGQKDLIPAVFEELGAQVIFHGVDVKPGMPAALAILNGVPVLALSGNPFAAAVTFELLARPAIAALASNPGFTPKIAELELEADFKKPRPTTRFQRGIIRGGTVSMPGEQGNGQMRTMMGCNCLVELPMGNDPLPAGTKVNAYLL